MKNKINTLENLKQIIEKDFAETKKDYIKDTLKTTVKKSITKNLVETYSFKDDIIINPLKVLSEKMIELKSENLKKFENLKKKYDITLISEEEVLDKDFFDYGENYFCLNHIIKYQQLETDNEVKNRLRNEFMIISRFETFFNDETKLNISMSVEDKKIVISYKETEFTLYFTQRANLDRTLKKFELKETNYLKYLYISGLLSSPKPDEKLLTDNINEIS